MRTKSSTISKILSTFPTFFLPFLFIGIFWFALPTNQAQAVASWYSTYSHRIKIPISATVAGAQTDYQMQIIIHSKSGTNSAGEIYLNEYLQDTTNFNDIRFTAADGTTLKNFWIQKVEDETGGRKATVYIKLDTPASGSTDYYLYYGKSADTSASNYDNTFTKDYGESGLVGLWHMDTALGTELLTDGGLETWTSTTDLTNWTENATSAERQIVQESTTKQAGSYSVKLLATANDGTTDFGIHQDVTTVNNEKYQVNFYQEYASRTQGTLKVEAWDNTNSVSLGSQSIAVAAASFSFISFRFTSTNTTNVRIKIYLNDETTGTVYIDALSVKQSSSALTDSSGSSNNGTISGASRTDTDGGQWDSSSSTVFATGSALQFDGKNDTVNLGSGSSLENFSAKSVFMWVKAPASAVGGMFYYGGYSDSPYGDYFKIYSISSFVLYLRNTSGTLVFGAVAFTPDTWIYIGYTWDGTTVRYYKNGTQVDIDSLLGTLGCSGADYYLGSYWAVNQWYTGLMDEVRIYSRALSGDEISRQYIRSKYASPAPTWATQGNEEQGTLAVSTQSAISITQTGAALNGSLLGFGGDASATVYFKWGLNSDNLNHTTDLQTLTDYDSFSQAITGLSADTTYHFQAFVQNSSTTTQSSILSFKTVALETDYYRAIINTDGSLTFTNKDTGAIILNNSPQFYFNYGSTTDTNKSPSNNSFETDDNSDGIPDSWSVDKNYIRLSTEQASDGSKSLKFDMTSSDTDHRRAYSPVITVTQEKLYNISFDYYLSSFTQGNLRAYIYYYDSSSGWQLTSSNTNMTDIMSYIPTDNVGSWQTITFDWIPPATAQSFEILFYMDKGSIATLYLDNVLVTEKSHNYTSNGSNLDYVLTNSGDSTTITVVDNSNAYVKTTHQYILNTHSPYIGYTATLQYKQNVSTTEERFDFIVPSQNAQVMTRDLQLTNFIATSTYWSDIYTSNVVKFTNGLVFLGSDTAESMRLRASGDNSQVSFYPDYLLNHPHFYFSSGPRVSQLNSTQHSTNDTYSVSVNFAINPSGSFKSLVKTRQPYGYDAALTLTNHTDDETLARIKAIAYGTENASDPTYGTKGLAGRGIGWTKSVFVSGVSSPYADLDDADFKTLIGQIYQDGAEIVAHSITLNIDSRSVVTAGLTTLSQYNAKNWIDHGASSGTGNFEDIASRGAIKGNSNYILDIFDQFNYQYAWSYIDLTTDNYALNILKPSAVSDVRPFLFYNNNVDDNLNDNKKIYLWADVNTNKIPDLYYTSGRIDTLISEKGVHISHEYYGYSDCENHVWYDDNGTIKIYPTFDTELEYIASKIASGLLWSPTMATLGDYLVPLKDVIVTYNSDGTITVTNNSSNSITGITLLAESNIQSVTIDNHELVSFGGTYGDKELVLPTLASGASVVLNITYGTKGASTPTIVSNDTGKNKVNEITGYWDSITKTLIMTAEARSGSRSFTVNIPSLANKTIVVKDITSTSTDIGEYTASATGTITFSGTLGSIHTFSLTEKPAAPTIGTPTVLSSSFIRWNFTDNADNETGFRVYTNADAIATSSATANLTYLDETGLSENTQYTRYIKAYNSYGESASSSATSTFTLMDAPTGFSFDTVTTNSLTISASGTLSNLASSTSGVYFDETSGNSGGADSTWLQTNSYQNPGLSENTQYTYRVKARNGDGTATSYTATSSKYTLANTPTNLDNSATRDSISLTVDSFPNASSGSSGYYFYRVDNTSRNSGWISKNSWADTGLTCGSKYTYGVKYRNGNSVETSAATLAQNTEPCVSEGGASENDNIDKEAEPIQPKKTDLNPQGNFSILINGDAEYTNSRTVKLKLFAGSDTKYMLVSENPNFSGAVQEKYVPDKTWTLSKGDGKKTIYAKFLTLYDIPSKVVSDSVILDTTAPSLSITDPKNYSSLTNNTPTIKGTSEPESTIVLELQTQDGTTSYYSTDTDENGNWDYTFLTPLTNQDHILKVTAQDALDNVSKPQTLSFKIQTQKVTLKPEIPVLIPPISPPAEEEQAITPPSIPEEQPSQEQEEAVPSLPEKEVSLPPLNLQSNLLLFKSLYGNISLKTPLTLISGQKLKLFLKPVKSVKAVKITIIFQKPAERDTSYESKNSVLSSILGIPSAQAQTWRIAEYTLTDENNNGIYEGEITLPETTGTYLIRTTLFYADGTIEDIDTETLIDPKGYIYTPAKDGQETRINKATISLYVFNLETSQFELWDSAKYGQENPQTTGKTGEYEFLVPEGKYYFQITAKGYQPYKGEAFQAQEGDVIHQNIELTLEKKVNNRFLIMGSVVLILVIGAGIGFWKKKRRG